MSLNSIKYYLDLVGNRVTTDSLQAKFELLREWNSALLAIKKNVDGTENTGKFQSTTLPRVHQYDLIQYANKLLEKDGIFRSNRRAQKLWSVILPKPRIQQWVPLPRYLHIVQV